MDNFTILISSGNSVSFANKYPKSISNGFIGINNGGWINNTSSITGLKSINVTIGSGSLLLSYGYSSSVYSSENITLTNTSGNHTFLYEPSYFKLANTSGATVNVYTLLLNYSCEFEDQTIGTSGLSFTLSADQKSYSVSKGTMSSSTQTLVIPAGI